MLLLILDSHKEGVLVSLTGEVVGDANATLDALIRLWLLDGAVSGDSLVAFAELLISRMAHEIPLRHGHDGLARMVHDAVERGGHEALVREIAEAVARVVKAAAERLASGSGSREEHDGIIRPSGTATERKSHGVPGRKIH
jgi:hypothetical protein